MTWHLAKDEHGTLYVISCGDYNTLHVIQDEANIHQPIVQPHHCCRLDDYALSHNDCVAILQRYRYLNMPSVCRLFSDSSYPDLTSPYYMAKEKPESKDSMIKICQKCSYGFKVKSVCNYIRCPSCLQSYCQCCMCRCTNDHFYKNIKCPVFNNREIFNCLPAKLETLLHWLRYPYVLFLFDNDTIAKGIRTSALQFNFQNYSYELHVKLLGNVVFIDDEFKGDDVWDCMAFRHWKPKKLQKKLASVKPFLRCIPPLPPIIIPLLLDRVPRPWNFCHICEKNTNTKNRMRHCLTKHHFFCEDCLVSHIQKTRSDHCPTCYHKIDTRGLPRECDICFELQEVRMCEGHKHWVCTSCLTSYVKTKFFWQATTCPGAGCNEWIDIGNLKGLTQEWYDGLFLSLFNSKLVKCPICETLYLKDNNKQHDWFQCQTCHSQICFQCECLWHEGKACEMKAELVEEVESFGLSLTQCPTCRTIMENDGAFCNKMTCMICMKRNHNPWFCCLCRQSFASEKACYSHFCRTLQDSQICEKPECSHCFIWPTKEVGLRAGDGFLKEFPQFKIK